MTKTRAVTVLLVDDDRGDVRAVERAFKKQRIANPIVVAKDGIEAFELLRGENGKQKIATPFLILLDLNMPRMNGIEFLRELRDDEHLHRSVVFVLTTSNHDKDRLAAHDQHVTGYLVKSRVGVDFVDLIKMLDAYWTIVEMPFT